MDGAEAGHVVALADVDSRCAQVEQAGDGAPRVVIYVNRTLVDTATGLKLTGRTEQFEKTDASLKTTGTNTYKQTSGTANGLNAVFAVARISCMALRAAKDS